ncbi:MAG: class I SAM-dependent methyltransferase [Desulfuromonadales bacterium]|nr:class I SAM-dependent methyltransferase [Desulfuromonadales bacterium]
MSDSVRRHYEEYPYPRYPLLASVRRCDTFALSLEALWSRFNGTLTPSSHNRILIAGCGSFAPYPFSLANPDANITALDLSKRSLDRARWHCLLHGRRNISFRSGDLLNSGVAPGPFALIDAYGVLHHLDDPQVGLRALAERLDQGGIMRVMVYSRYARREEESIRRALRLLKVRDVATAKRLFARTRPGSRLHHFVTTSPEAGFAAGLADALLHPCVHTFRIDNLMELVDESGLQPLLFAHADAFENVHDEVDRIRRMEARQESPGNFVVFLGRGVSGPCQEMIGSLLVINPCLRDSIGPFRLSRPRIPARLGHPTPHLGWRERHFLRRFIRPVPWNTLTHESQIAADIYTKALFLLQYRP